MGDTVRAAEREGGARRGAGCCAGGAAGSGSAERCGSGAGEVQKRSGSGAVRCDAGAVRRSGGAGLSAGGSGTRLALISYSNFSAPTQPARHWPDVMSGDVTPARRPLAAGCGRSCSDYHISASGGAAAPARALGGNFSSLLICISLYTFFLSLSSIPAAYLPSHLSFSFPGPLGLLHPFPLSVLPWHIYHFHLYIYFFLGGEEGVWDGGVKPTISFSRIYFS